MRKNRKVYSVIELILFVLALVAIWQILYEVGVEGLGIWKSYAMPSPMGVMNSLFKQLRNGVLLQALGRSLLRALWGYFLSCVIGIVLGIVINRVGFLNRNLRPIIMGVQTLPSICWVPFSILWLGLTEKAIIFVVGG